MAISFPVPDARPSPRFPVLSSRQETFCRQFVATGNAAESARRAGYAERSARQTGHALLDRPHIIERVRRIRLLWRETARREARLLLERLEQAWQVAVAQDSSYTMLQVIRMQAELSGLSRRGLARRVDLWPLPDEDEFGELATALEAGESAEAARPGPLAEVLGRGGAAAAGAGGAPESAPADAPDDAPDEPPAIAPDDPAVYADPPEEHYDAVSLCVARRGPDLQRGDDKEIDGVEAGWLYALRNGFDPIDPSSDEQIALEAENAARLAANPSGIAWKAMPPPDNAPEDGAPEEADHDGS